MVPPLTQLSYVDKLKFVGQAPEATILSVQLATPTIL